MRRIGMFLGFALIVLSVLGCEIPSTIKIEGNPKLEFVDTIDFSETFSDMLDEGFGSNDEITVVDAVRTSSDYKTFVIYMDLFTQELDNPVPFAEGDIITVGKNPFTGEDITFTIGPDFKMTLPQDVELASVDQAFSLPLDFSEYLDGFKINTDELKASLYLDGSPVIESLEIELKINGAATTSNGALSLQSINIDEAGIWEKLPAGGWDASDAISAMLEAESDADTELSAKVILPAGTEIDVNYLDDQHISAELLIWFPLVFEADGTSEVNGMTGAEIKVEQLNEAGDFITQLAEAEILEGIHVELDMSRNQPFKDAYLIIQDESNPNFMISNKASDSSINFALSKSDIDYINDSDNFAPTLSIFFENGGTLGIPKGELAITGVRVDAEIGTYVVGEED